MRDWLAIWGVGGLVVIAAACGEDRAREEADPPTVPPPAEAPAATGGEPVDPLSLLGIMRGLESSMTRLHAGLWVEDFDEVAAAARAVAEHPQVPPEERIRIQSILGPDFPAFVTTDRTVHDAGIRLSERAMQRDTSGMLDALAQLQEACVSCHTSFRSRVRDAP